MVRHRYTFYCQWNVSEPEPGPPVVVWRKLLHCLAGIKYIDGYSYNLVKCISNTLLRETHDIVLKDRGSRENQISEEIEIRTNFYRG